MQGNSERKGALLDIGRAGRRAAGPRLADVDPEIAAAGGPHLETERHPSVKANNLGLIGVAVKLEFSGRELDIPVSLELYEDLDPSGLHTYLSDAARRLGACEPIGKTHRLFLLPDSY
jgi:hypothetical protein